MTEKNEDKNLDSLVSLCTDFKKIKDDAENFINNNKNNEYLLEFRDIMIHKNMKNLDIQFEYDLLLSILHFAAISEINGILFSLFEEIKKSFHYLKNKKYNSNNNFFFFLKNLVLYDSSQINFNFITSLFSSLFIGVFTEPGTYLLCFFIDIVLLIVLFLFHVIELEEEYENEFIYLIKTIIFYALIYFFTGIISLFPFHILKNKNSPFNLLVGNTCSFIGVLIKNLIHFGLLYLDLHNYFFYIIQGIIFILLSLIYAIFLYKRKKNDIIYPIYGYLNGKFSCESQSSNITLKFQGFCKFLSTLFSCSKDSQWIFFILNFFSRAQKILFKSKFKNEFDEKSPMIYNFIFSYCIYLIFMLLYDFYYYKCYKPKKSINQFKNIQDTNENNKKDNVAEKENEKKEVRKEILDLISKKEELRNGNKLKEIFLYYLIFLENSSSLECSILFLIYGSTPEISFISIFIGGTINFILTEYYSTQNIEYLPLSGFISFLNLLFKCLEIYYSVFKDDIWIFIQIVFAFFGLIISLYKLVKQFKLYFYKN